MYYLTVALCWAVCVYAAPPPPPPTSVVPLEKQQPTVIPIVSQSEELEPNGTYKFSYETGNGIKREETSYDKVVPKAKGRKVDSNEGGESNEGDSDEIHVQQGSYSYTAPDGTVISVRYIADENGFQPIGDHIPRSPIPASGSSAERNSKSLKDSAAAESTPIVASRSGEKLKEKVKSSEGSGEAPSPNETPEGKTETSTVEVPVEVSTESASTATAPTDSSSSTEPAENAKTTESNSSTTESKTEGTTESSTTVAEKEASTTEGGKDSSTTEGASTPTESSTKEPSTTEAASTSLAA